MKKILVVILALSLLGAACKKAGGGVSLLSKTDWPEACAEKELYKGFPEEYLMPNISIITSTSMGFGGEVASTGEELPEKTEGFGGSFCTESSVEEVVSWYDKTLIEKGFHKLGEMDGEHIYEKGRSNINVAAYDLEEGFVLYSFTILTRNYN